MFEARSYRWMVGALAALGVGFLIFPVLVTVVVSFEPSAFIAFPPTGFSLKWYGQIASITRIGEATLNSLWTAVATAIFATGLGGLAAFALVRGSIPFSGAVTGFLVSPASLPMVAIGMALIQFFILTGLAFSWVSLVIGHVILVLAYPIRTIVSSLVLADQSQEQAAASLGATPMTVFRTVTLAQIAPGVVSGFLFAFLISFDNYPVSLFLVRGSLTTMPIEVFNYINQNVDPTPAAFSTIYILIVTAVIVLLENRFRIISQSVPE